MRGGDRNMAEIVQKLLTDKTFRDKDAVQALAVSSVEDFTPWAGN